MRFFRRFTSVGVLALVVVVVVGYAATAAPVIGDDGPADSLQLGRMTTTIDDAAAEGPGHRRTASDVAGSNDTATTNNETAANNNETTTTNETTTNSSVSNATARLNIVLFYADDWTVKTLGIFNKLVLTPNLDAMARRGMAFTHNCVTTSICWMSRATKYTGLYSSVHRQLSVSTLNMFNGTVKWNDTLYPKLFAAGYHTGYFGKWHAPMLTEYRLHTFNSFKNYYGNHWCSRDGVRKHVTECNRMDALDYLRSINGSLAKGRIRNFALTVAFFAPHAVDNALWPNAYQPDKSSAQLYRNVSKRFPLPRTATLAAWKKMPWFFAENNEGRARWRNRFKDETYRQESIERVYRLLSEIDKAVGDVMEEVRNMGLYNNTMFIFTSDNGVFYGEHGLADKWYPHEESIRVPLIIEDPRMLANLKGRLNSEFTLNVDLAPTMLSAAGVEVPARMQGRDIASLYTAGHVQARSSWRKDFFYEFSWTGANVKPDPSGFLAPIPPVFALVSKAYKYFYWPLKRYQQLFNVATDPYEERDVMNTTSLALLRSIKARYAYLKSLSQNGGPV